MTVSELKYLIAVSKAKGGEEENDLARMSVIARNVGVSKVSVYHGMERLEEGGYIERIGKQISITEKGWQALAEYEKLITFISGHLVRQFGIPEDVAYEDAIGATCAFSDVSRKAIVSMLNFGR